MSNILIRQHDAMIDILSELLIDEDTYSLQDVHNLTPLNNTGISRENSKIGFMCTEKTSLQCICAIILTHIQESHELSYQPPPQYSIFNSRDHYVPVVVSFNTFSF